VPRRLSQEQLRRLTLQRQFPQIRGRGHSAVVELLSRLGPVQSQVPRAPFMSAAARLPGIGYAAITTAFNAYDIVKATSLRGTVHVSTRAHFPLIDAVSQRTLAAALRNQLKLRRLDVADVRHEVERYAAGVWRDRADLLEHMRHWLAEHESAESAAATKSQGASSLVRAHSALLRRPTDGAWDRRTDALHRLASTVFDITPVDADAALVELTRVHLASYGPATRRDVAWWTGETLTRVDAAIDRLGDEVVRLRDVDGVTYLDLAEGVRGGNADPGVRLLPEYDGLLLGYAPAARSRFLNLEHLDRVWFRKNGVFAPLVLMDGRIVATWRLVTARRQTHLAVCPIPGERAVRTDELAEPIAALEAALNLTIGDVDLKRQT
jgi:Winged helix DNA-binding domain